MTAHGGWHALKAMQPVWQNTRLLECGMHRLLQLLFDGRVTEFAVLRMLGADEIRTSPSDEGSRCTSGHEHASQSHLLG